MNRPRLMRCLSSLGVGLAITCLAAGPVGAAGTNPDDVALRGKLVGAILSKGAAQQKLLGELGDSGSAVVREVLLAWTRDSVYLFEATNAVPIPVLLEDQQDAAGKARA
ncbi:MAG: hypothetical protein KGS61_12625, partial [Verrucomicrobia bacterium]|nr:hypothetical protein [Verrucomicrobiota bacterium]